MCQDIKYIFLEGENSYVQFRFVHGFEIMSYPYPSTHIKDTTTTRWKIVAITEACSVTIKRGIESCQEAKTELDKILLKVESIICLQQSH